MGKQEELFKQFQLLGKSFQNLGGIIQNENQTVTWEQIEEFDRTLDILVKDMQRLRMPTILHLKESGLIKKS